MGHFFNGTFEKLKCGRTVCNRGLPLPLVLRSNWSSETAAAEHGERVHTEDNRKTTGAHDLRRSQGRAEIRKVLLGSNNERPLGGADELCDYRITDLSRIG